MFDEIVGFILAAVIVLAIGFGVAFVGLSDYHFVANTADTADTPENHCVYIGTIHVNTTVARCVDPVSHTVLYVSNEGNIQIAGEQK